MTDPTGAVELTPPVSGHEPEPAPVPASVFLATVTQGSTAPASSLALDATVSAAEHASSLAAPLATPTAGPHSTVLPHLELRDGELHVSQRARPRYEEVRRLGEGGMGEVVLARDNDIGRVVAVKRLLPHLTADATVARFAEEIRTVGRLGHPGIAPIHDVGVDERGQLFFVMKYVDGETLEAIIAQLAAGSAEAHAKYPFERRVQIMMGLLEALAYAHDHGVVHRDVKPSNVMIGAYGEVVLMDWGVAKVAERGPGGGAPELGESPEVEAALVKSGRLHATQQGALVGTPLYMSPEQATGAAHIDARSDIYSLSVLFHELLTLRHYLHGRDKLSTVVAGVLQEGPPRAADASWALSPLQGRVGADLAHLVIKGMQKDPERRYRSAREMLERLQRRAAGDIPIDCHVTLWITLLARARRLADRHPRFVALGLPVAVLVSLAAMIYSAVRLVLG
ncbi:MAG TPA: serine/threonine-protein kinase [Polyangiaceae bacterium]|nr:serine/threonine-protein kinase [Polyangiaceae bacterium]